MFMITYTTIGLKPFRKMTTTGRAFGMECCRCFPEYILVGDAVYCWEGGGVGNHPNVRNEFNMSV